MLMPKVLPQCVRELRRGFVKPKSTSRRSTHADRVPKLATFRRRGLALTPPAPLSTQELHPTAMARRPSKMQN
eukprot:CAMPEP_0206470388 /NCGR_PEP_ID=MMETSP0324_2-20121206/30899_1 /ASSEMBLY_ACC=CAM_ASM_000836 /TAXON_ID=2866 /ORGANISM="Crypthecodinium cohnii, Strain Seligo" /LENGTH=72 /DNA_ID=CAMNT_0053944435 /DNA_START=320 /DNA_END=535 /DNA_ORIENTATION=+